MTAAPPIADRETWQVQLDELRVREKAHTREGDAIAAARRRLPMVEVDPTTPLVGPSGDVRLIDTFEGRTPPMGAGSPGRTPRRAGRGCTSAQAASRCAPMSTAVPLVGQAAGPSRNGRAWPPDDPTTWALRRSR